MKLVLRELLRGLLVGSGIYIFSLMVSLLGGRDLDMDRLTHLFWGNAVVPAIIYLCNAAAIILLKRRYKKELFTKKYIAYGVLANIGASLLGIFISRFLLLVLVQGMSLERILAVEYANRYVTPFLIAVGATLLFYLAYFYRNYKERQVKEQKIIAGSASARFDALKNQLDPHFLFNSLNVLTSLIEEDPQQAQKFT